METTKEKHATFTPGPWQLSCIDGVEDSLMVGGGDDGSDIVADIRDEANARLIAAAPEMYEVLKEIFRLSEIGLSSGILYGKKLVTEMGTENIPTHEKVRAILAKVEGETE